MSNHVIPIFNQVNTVVYALSTLADTGISNYWAGYAAPGSDLGATATTTAVWQDIGGFYLFLDSVPNNWEQFTADLLSLRPNLGPANLVRFVWIGKANQPMAQWQLSTGLAQPSGSGQTISWSLTRSIGFQLDAYSFILSGASRLTYIADSDGGGIKFNSGAFNGPAGGYTFTTASILFSGTTLGAFSRSTLNIPAGNEQSSLWSALNIGLQYAAAPSPISDASIHPLGPEKSIAYAQATQILFMPVFAATSPAINLGLTFDPLHPLMAMRTGLSLFPSVGNGNGTLILNSFLRTTKGYTIQLKPMAANGAFPDARFVFGACPVEGSDPASGLRYHLSPDGAFAITIPPPQPAPTITTNQVLLGLSGLEYASLDHDEYMVVFEGNHPAFIPVAKYDKRTAPQVSGALTNLATTSHLTVLSQTNKNTGPVYYAQPVDAPVFSGKQQRNDGILSFNEMPAFLLTHTDQLPPVFPVGIYAGLKGESILLARQIENSSLAPYRNYCIGKAYGTASVSPHAVEFSAPKRRERSVNDPLGVTPQGLVAELTPDYKDFDGLIIGNMPGTNYPTVDLTVVKGAFKQVLQSNQLFFVAANIDVLMTATSVRYQLTAAEKPFLLAMGVPLTVVDAVYLAVNGQTQPFNTEQLFVACIGTAAGTYLPSFLKITGLLKVEMDGWTFQLSPRSWRKDAETPTLMLAKFCDRSLIDLANDSSSWAWPEVAIPAKGTIGQTQAILLNLFNAAAASDAAIPLRIFYDNVLNNPNWNGFLFLNAPVDIAELPDELKFLTAGIDLTKFYANHIGFSQTPFTVQAGNPQLEQTAAFGLIDYVDTVDLYAEETIPLGFKTMKLRARFANATLADFSTEVELMLNRLLGSLLSKKNPARGNNLIIEGAYQRVGGAASYAFTLTGENVFYANNAALVQLEVLSVQLVTGGDTSGAEVLTTFVLMGNLRFLLIPQFDMFSYGPEEDSTDGYLRFNGFSIDMSFSMVKPEQQTFITKEGNMGFDDSVSVKRQSSLVNNFPVIVSALIASPNLSGEGEMPSGQTPEDLGYTSISVPLDQTPMTPSWYGLVYTLDLGTFGALTGSKGFKLSILSAWSIGSSQDDIPVYVGLKLPGISAIAGSFPLQGVLKLGFRSFQFETYPDNGQLGYLLRLKRFALSVFIWSFPPGNSEIVLFGQPGNPRGSLGWYAAYDEDKKPDAPKMITTQEDQMQEKSIQERPVQETSVPVKSVPDRVQRRLRSGRRTPPIS